ncbi:MAG: hypothetical protein HDT47_01645 [Ruminococcaceae bacterium]|nr:hypothetical protein [Oscillospiraceae bacterium]
MQCLFLQQKVPPVHLYQLLQCISTKTPPTYPLPPHPQKQLLPENCLTAGAEPQIP